MKIIKIVLEMWEMSPTLKEYVERFLFSVYQKISLSMKFNTKQIAETMHKRENVRFLY